MKIRSRSRYSFVLTATGLLCAACGSTRPSAPGSPLVHAEGRVLVDGRGRATRLQGVAFSSDEDLTEQDYQRVSDMGFGSVRLDFDASAWIDDSDSSALARLLAWLDDQLASAKQHDLLLILAMKRRPASTPGHCVIDSFWDDATGQERWLTAWEAIAERYAHEPAVAGYDLLHEPTPSTDLEQWRTIGNRLASAIRESDPLHLLIFEQAQSVACTPVDLRPDLSLAVLDDSNVAYAFEARGPYVFTTQASARSVIDDGGSYPDELSLGTVDWQRMKFEASDMAAPLVAGETDWVPKKHYYSPVKPSICIAQVNLRSDNNRGTVYFDDLLVEELAPNFDFIRQVLHADLEDATSWFLWQDPAGSASGVKGVSADHHTGKASITLSATTSDANLSNDAPFIFPVKTNNTYRVTGWMKGEVSDKRAASMIGLSLWSYDGDLPLRNAANLTNTVQPFVDWGQAHEVPLFASAFGASAATFGEGKGGLSWVSDMLDVLDRDKLSFCYDSYGGQDFGIYPQPGRANQPLADLFGQRLAHAAPSAR